MSQHYANVPTPSDSHFDRGYGNGNSGVADFATGNPSATMSSPLGQSMGQQGFGGQFHEDFDANSRPVSTVGAPQGAGVNRSASSASTAVANAQANQGTPSRNNTLKKKASIRRTGSLKRSSSRKSLAAGSIRSVGGKSVAGGNETEDFNSAFHTPIPTQGSPTDILANRFQSWRQLLKSLVAYFREIQNSYDVRAKAVTKVQSAMGGIAHPPVFASDNGLADATRILEDFHRHSIAEANKSREIENDVIAGLTGLRSDLSQKIKEIKSLSGDFKNSVDKEKEATRREVEKLQEALQHADHEDSSAVGKNDPFVVRLGVDRAVEKQIDEENYLHRAYLNLEASGRELESIVVGEIQKAYNAFAGILKREGDDAYKAVEGLRSGPISMPKDHEWSTFVNHDPHFVAPDVPLRRIEEIDYPGRDHPAASEIRAGMLERKSKYLKSYSPGWYVLSPTHLHEFKSADKIYTQPPVMSLYLADQKLGTHSEPGSSSAKFMLKGRQAGGMHKGHSWVFRAESHETMLAWYQDIKTLTEKTGEERTAFIRKHARSVSGNSERPHSFSSDGLGDEDEADQVPYSADAASLSEQNPVEAKPQRPQPGGRFPSDLNIPRNSNTAQSPSSESSDRDTINAAAALPASYGDDYGRSDEDPYRLRGVASGGSPLTPGSAAISRAPPTAASYDDDQERYMANPQPYQMQPPQQQQAPIQNQTFFLPGQQPTSTYQEPQSAQTQPAQTEAQPARNASTGSRASLREQERMHSSYKDWLAPAAVGAGAGAAGTAAYNHHQQSEPKPEVQQQQTPMEPGIAGDRSIEDPMPAAPTTTNTTAPAVADNSIDAAPTYLSYPSSAGPDAGLAGSSAAPVPLNGSSALGGQEASGAHETGHIFPSVVRHDTDISVSQLHVPGSFPKRN